MPNSNYNKQSWHLYFGSDLAHLEVLRVSNAAEQSLRLLAEQIDSLVLI